MIIQQYQFPNYLANDVYNIGEKNNDNVIEIIKKDTNEKIYFNVIVKGKNIMNDNIALHGLVPKNELPKKLRGKISKNEVWVRNDIWNNQFKKNMTRLHEQKELELMINYNMTYKKAHAWSEMVDGVF